MIDFKSSTIDSMRKIPQGSVKIIFIYIYIYIYIYLFIYLFIFLIV
ncbi:hypothetical protein K6L59_02835 [Candidatus Phytoplasma sp. Tabriz.2]|nr:hypothetical protein [Candidatus Phytoplasma australiense]